MSTHQYSMLPLSLRTNVHEIDLEHNELFEFLELSKEINVFSQRLARLKGKISQLGGDEEGPPADSKPPHW